jgi:hypothetical protein
MCESKNDSEISISSQAMSECESKCDAARESCIENERFSES